jgi:hypothetical protein
MTACPTITGLIITGLIITGLIITGLIISRLQARQSARCTLDLA